MIKDLTDKREQAAAASGYTYVGKVGDEDIREKHNRCDHGVYKRLGCGHQRVFLHTNIEKGIKDCKQCRHEEHIAYAESLGMTFVKFSRPNNKGTLYIDVLMACGHYKSIQTGNLHVKGWRCEQCFLSKLNEVTDPYGIVMIKPLGKTDWECTLPCGCSGKLKINNARKGSWSCETHKTSYIHWQSKIYLIRIASDAGTWLKLGVSYKTETRGEKYGIKVPYSFEILKEVDFPTGLVAVNIEKKLHKKYRAQRCCPDEIRTTMTTSGHTECYPLEMETILIQELEVLSTYNGENVQYGR